MDGHIVGLVAVIMIFGIPIAGMYTYYRVRRLRSEERLAALARGLSIPMEPELSQAARSRRAGILLVSASIGYTDRICADCTRRTRRLGRCGLWRDSVRGRTRLLPRFNSGTPRPAGLLRRP